MKTGKFFLAVGLVILLMVLVGSVIQAQGSCEKIVILNESQQHLDETAICSVAQSWIEAGFQVYIFVSDEDPLTEDDWWAIRDRVEGSWGIYDATNDTFAKGAVAIELTTVTRHPWGQDLAFGEYLFGTPLDSDVAIGRIEGRLKNKVAEGDITAAIVDTLEQAYETASLSPVTAPVVQEKSLSQPKPTVVQLQPTRPETPVGKTSFGFPFGKAILLLLGIVVIGGGGILLVLFVGIPLFQRMITWQDKREHLEDLRKKVNRLLVGAEQLLSGESVEETTLWRLFAIHNGGLYPELADQVHEWIRRSRVALDEAFRLHEELREREPDSSKRDFDSMIRAFEMIYLTLVGTDPRVLQMSEDQFRFFVDPLAAGISPQIRDVALVEQLRAIRGQLTEYPLRIELKVVKPESLGDTIGILGYAAKIKDEIGRLSRAQTEGEKTLTAAVQVRSQAAEGQFPKGLSADSALTVVDDLLTQAQSEAKTGRWLNVVDLAQQASVLIREIVAFLPVLNRAFNQYHQDQQLVRGIINAGYRLPSLVKSQAELAAIIKRLYTRVSMGTLEDAQRSLQNLQDESANLLRAAQALVELRGKNETELKRLFVEVARVEGYRVQTVQPAWQTLQAYPSGNWSDLAQTAPNAMHTLRSLFDNLSSPDDLASRIARRNSMQEQQFVQAEQMLIEAFAVLLQIEEQLKAIVARLTQVQEIERSVVSTLQAVEVDIAKARARRDRDDVKIDAAVDRQIIEAERLLEQGSRASGAREFMVAHQAFTRCRQLAIQAYAAADKQAKAIDVLYVRLANFRVVAAEQVSQAQVAQNQLPPAAQKASTAGKVQEAADLFRKAQQAESTIGGKQDRALAEVLQKAVSLYEQAQTQAQQALTQVGQDKMEYERWIHSSQSAIATAESAISTAGRYVRNSDAGGAGGTSLRQASSSLPSLPSYGATPDAYRYTIAQAERAQELAEQAETQAQARIAEVETAREAERRRKAEEERRRREAEEATRRAREAAQRAAEEARRRSHSSSFGSPSSSRSSSMGSSLSRGSTSMGSSRRR